MPALVIVAWRTRARIAGEASDAYMKSCGNGAEATVPSPSSQRADLGEAAGDALTPSTERRDREVGKARSRRRRAMRRARSRPLLKRLAEEASEATDRAGEPPRRGLITRDDVVAAPSSPCRPTAGNIAISTVMPSSPA